MNIQQRMRKGVMRDYAGLEFPLEDVTDETTIADLKAAFRAQSGRQDPVLFADMLNRRELHANQRVLDLWPGLGDIEILVLEDTVYG